MIFLSKYYIFVIVNIKYKQNLSIKDFKDLDLLIYQSKQKASFRQNAGSEFKSVIV